MLRTSAACSVVVAQCTGIHITDHDCVPRANHSIACGFASFAYPVSLVKLVGA